MRFLIRVLMFFAVLWCLWWALASWGAQRGLTGVFEARQSDGWQADIAQSGFPFRIRSGLSNVVLTAPNRALSLQAQRLGISAPTHWPGNLRVELPATPILLQTQAGLVEIEAADAFAGVSLTPNTALPLERVNVESGAVALSFAGQRLMTARTLLAAAYQSADDPLRYDAQVRATGLAPGAMIRKALALEDDWPQTFEAFQADVDVTFDRALDRFAAEDPRPQPRRIEVRGVDIRWGEVDMRAEGMLDIDATGAPTGELNVQYPNWRRQVDLAYGTGLFDPATQGTAELVLAAMANRVGSPDDLDLVVTFAGGRMNISGIDLGPAPRLRFD